MSINHTLSNPTSAELGQASDLVNEATTEEPTINFPAPNQIRLNLPTDNKFKRALHQIVLFLKTRESEMEIMPFWKDIAPPLAFVSSGLLVFVLFIYGIIQFSKIPPRIQFYYDAIQGRWEQADKIIVLFLPVLLLVLDSLILRFTYDIFRYDRRLSRVLSWVLSIFNLLTIVAIGQIYSLI